MFSLFVYRVTEILNNLIISKNILFDYGWTHIKKIEINYSLKGLKEKITSVL